MKKVSAVLFAVLLFSGSAFAAGAGEIVIKGGLGVGGTTDPKIDISATDMAPFEIKGGKILEPFFKGEKGGKSISIGAEYLYPVNESVKVGAGIQYVSVKDAKIALDLGMIAGSSFGGIILSDPKICFDYSPTTIPLYATIQFAPAKEGKVKGLYFKASAGYEVYYDNSFDFTPEIESIFEAISVSSTDPKPTVKVECSGGLYYGLGMGYEFDGSGIIVELGYESFSGFVKHTLRGPGGDGKLTIETSADYYHVGLKIGYKIAL